MKNVMCKQTGLVRELQEISMYKSILEQILENAYEGVVVTDATGKIIMLNNAYANYLGIDAQAAIAVLRRTALAGALKGSMPMRRSVSMKRSPLVRCAL